jgi:CRISPR system Cascade subunit CasB
MSQKDKILYPFPQWKPDDHSFAILKDWWQALASNKGERAFLKRAETLNEVVFCPAFHWLLRSLRKEGYSVSEARLQKLAAIAGLAARMKEDMLGSLGSQLGAVNPIDKPSVSELRMRRILACDDLEELYMLLRRALAIVGGNASLSGLAATIWQWEPIAEKRPFDSRKQLAYDYYAAATMQHNNNYIRRLI